MSAPATRRLILRQWQQDDYEPFAAMNADPHVMEYFGATRSRAQSDATANRLAAHIDDYDFGFWALERRDNGAFIGVTGLMNVDFDSGFLPAVEIGWRLAHDQWGQGFATEAAHAALAFGFDRLGLAEIVSFAVIANRRSRQVMERLGMQHVPERDFDHPHVAGYPALRRHAFYTISRDKYRPTQSTHRS